MTSAKSVEDGWVEWNLISGEDTALNKFLASLRDGGCDVDLVKTKRLTKRQILTTRQEEIIKIALQSGYYDTPKKTTINKLAKSFGISPSTLAEILQRAEKKIIDKYFMENK
jgi:predicted DNA binding protein